MKPHKINDTLYHVELLFFVGNGAETASYINKKFDKDYSDIIEESLGGVVFCGYAKDGHMILAMWVHEPKFSIIAHECVHIASIVFEDRSIPFTSKNDEIIAYYIEFWVRNIENYLNRKEH